MEEGPGRVVYRVAERDRGRRLDLFLKERIPRMSREGVKEMIRTRVRLAGRGAARPSTALRAGDEVIVAWPLPADPPSPAAGPAPRPVFEDEDLLVVDKPSGLLVHATASSRGPSLLSWMAAAGRGPLHLVHRLDRDTSGLVVLARNRDAARVLSGAFAAGRVEKRYLAIVFGEIGPEEGTIDRPLGPDLRSAVHVKQAVDPRGGRPARTSFRVIERLAGYTLVEALPMTGRRHQIRVHLGAIGHPVVGDRLYGPRESHHLRWLARGFDARMREELLSERHLLHASRLALPHPRTGAPLALAAPLPPDMVRFLEERRARPGGSSEVDRGAQLPPAPEAPRRVEGDPV